MRSIKNIIIIQRSAVGPLSFFSFLFDIKLISMRTIGDWCEYHWLAMQTRGARKATRLALCARFYFMRAAKRTRDIFGAAHSIQSILLKSSLIHAGWLPQSRTHSAILYMLRVLANRRPNETDHASSFQMGWAFQWVCVYIVLLRLENATFITCTETHRELFTARTDDILLF